MRAQRDAQGARHVPGRESTASQPLQVRELLASVGVVVPNTRKWVLAPFRDTHAVVDALLEWRKAERIATTYGYGWLAAHVGSDDRLRGAWTTCDGAAGRMTAQNGLHNLPAALRPAITAHAGHVFVRADLGQIEPRVLAAVSGGWAFAAATGPTTSCAGGHRSRRGAAHRQGGRARGDVRPAQRTAGEALEASSARTDRDGLPRPRVCRGRAPRTPRTFGGRAVPSLGRDQAPANPSPANPPAAGQGKAGRGRAHAVSTAGRPVLDTAGRSVLDTAGRLVRGTRGERHDREGGQRSADCGARRRPRRFARNAVIQGAAA